MNQCQSHFERLADRNLLVLNNSVCDLLPGGLRIFIPNLFIYCSVFDGLSWESQDDLRILQHKWITNYIPTLNQDHSYSSQLAGHAICQFYISLWRTTRIISARHPGLFYAIFERLYNLLNLFRSRQSFKRSTKPQNCIHRHDITTIYDVGIQICTHEIHRPILRDGRMAAPLVFRGKIIIFVCYCQPGTHSKHTESLAHATGTIFDSLVIISLSKRDVIMVCLRTILHEAMFTNQFGVVCQNSPPIKEVGLMSAQSETNGKRSSARLL